MQVEREVVSFYAALLLEKRVGEEFDATVSSLADFGFFVELDLEHIEGLVKGETVEPRFRFDPLTYAMVFGSGRRLRVGAKLRVRLASVNLQRRQIDFEVVQFGDEPAQAEPEAPRQRAPRGRAPHHEEVQTHPSARPNRPVERPAMVETRPSGHAARPHRPAPQVARDAAPAPTVHPRVELAGQVEAGSPHPGFDRLRALAAKGSAREPAAPAKGGRDEHKRPHKSDSEGPSKGGANAGKHGGGGRFKGRRR
jgi:ribonuclease R